jgi:hypothetical protein
VRGCMCPPAIERLYSERLSDVVCCLDDRMGALEGFDRLDERFLNNIITVDHRVRHAGGIAMQPRTHFNQKAVERFSGGPAVWS